MRIYYELRIHFTVNQLYIMQGVVTFIKPVEPFAAGIKIFD